MSDAFERNSPHRITWTLIFTGSLKVESENEGGWVFFLKVCQESAIKINANDENITACRGELGLLMMNNSIATLTRIWLRWVGPAATESAYCASILSTPYPWAECFWDEY